jgi:hypothetical protein
VNNTTASHFYPPGATNRSARIMRAPLSPQKKTNSTKNNKINNFQDSLCPPNFRWSSRHEIFVTENMFFKVCHDEK